MSGLGVSELGLGLQAALLHERGRGSDDVSLCMRFGTEGMVQ